MTKARRPGASSPEALARMKAQKRRDTKPELVVRQLLTEMGRRYRVASATLPGSPDISNKTRGWAVFVHGCYWHHHPGCPRATVPKKNRAWWVAKFERNRERDQRKVGDLESLGLEVLVIWECETKDPAALRRRLRRQLSRLPKRQ